MAATGRSYRVVLSAWGGGAGVPGGGRNRGGGNRGEAGRIHVPKAFRFPGQEADPVRPLDIPRSKHRPHEMRDRQRTPSRRPARVVRKESTGRGMTRPSGSGHTVARSAPSSGPRGEEARVQASQPPDPREIVGDGSASVWFSMVARNAFAAHRSRPTGTRTVPGRSLRYGHVEA